MNDKKPKWATIRQSVGVWLWSEKEDEFLKKNASNKSGTEIAATLGRSHAATKVRSATLGISLTALKHPWLEEEDLFLKRHAADKTTKDMAASLNRTPSAVQQRAVVLGVGLIAYGLRGPKLPEVGETHGTLVATGSYKKVHNRWLVEIRCPHGGIYFIDLVGWRCGQSKSCQQAKECPVQYLRQSPEFRTVRAHHYWIFKSSRQKSYKGMPFFDGWNPDKGGSFMSGALWIVENLKRRPEGRTIHVRPTGKGFVPGNLRWAPPKQQSQEQWFKIVAQLEHDNERLKNELEAQEFISGVLSSTLETTLKETA